MIKRSVEKPLLSLARQYPVVTVTGPRQSGKTSLCKKLFPSWLYCSLEDLDVRDYANHDPKGFLRQADKMLIDEIQRAPALTSYIQGIVDQTRRAGQFILTGSHQFELTNVVSQSLAGRAALIKLLPFSLKELKTKHLKPKTPWARLAYRGFYPRIIDKKLNPTQALSFYTNTYLQRDLRDLKEIKSLRRFEIFLKLCARNTGQILNKNRLANDIGVGSKTIDAWVSVLQASYIIFLLQPHFRNFRKRVVKSPKLYFYDVGLSSYLLGIKKESHVLTHPLKGFLFENLVIADRMKQAFNKAQDPSFYYFRDNSGNEVDLLEETGADIISYEIKAGQSLSREMFKGLDFYKNLNPENKKSLLIYAGNERHVRYGHECLPWRSLA